MSYSKPANNAFVAVIFVPLIFIRLMAHSSRSGIGSADPALIIPAFILIGFVVLLASSVQSADEARRKKTIAGLRILSRKTEGSEPPPSRRHDNLANLMKRTGEAAAMKARKAKYESLLSEQERLAQALTRYRCFYDAETETFGPVTLWRVHELIEMGRSNRARK